MGEVKKKNRMMKKKRERRGKEGWSSGTVSVFPLVIEKEAETGY